MKTMILSGAAVAALSSAAAADITFTMTNRSWAGFSFSDFVDYSQYNVVGSLTGASINVTLNSSTAYTYCDDLCVYVDIAPLSLGGFLQVGGFSNLNAAQRYSWPNGGSSSVGTTAIGSVNFATALNFTGDRTVDGSILIGNGYGAAGTSGTWTGTVTLRGINIVAIPAPGAVALLGIAGLATGRRRRA